MQKEPSVSLYQNKMSVSTGLHLTTLHFIQINILRLPFLNGMLSHVTNVSRHDATRQWNKSDIMIHITGACNYTHKSLEVCWFYDICGKVRVHNGNTYKEKTAARGSILVSRSHVYFQALKHTSLTYLQLVCTPKP